jgi:prepilin-type N-terminal cleavage/methylation domain-containing protein
MSKSAAFINSRRQAGFTMVELAIVLVIAGIILVGALKGTDMINKAKIERVTADLKGLQGMLLEHEKRTGRLPGDCNENGIIEFDSFTADAVWNNIAPNIYSLDSDPDTDRCSPANTAETDVNRVWSDLRKANIVDPTRTNVNVTKHTLTDFYAVGSFTPGTPAGGPVNTIVAYGLPLWLAKGVDVAIDGPQPVNEELAGGKRGRVRLLYDDGGALHDNGDDWPAEAHDYQFVAISFQFDTRMSRPKP